MNNMCNCSQPPTSIVFSVLSTSTYRLSSTLCKTFAQCKSRRSRIATPTSNHQFASSSWPLVAAVHTVVLLRMTTIPEPSETVSRPCRRFPFHFVWKMFWIMRVGAASAAALSAATSPSESRHPRAPRLSFACRRFLAPGIGTVFWHMHQLMATCGMRVHRHQCMIQTSQCTRHLNCASSTRCSYCNCSCIWPGCIWPCTHVHKIIDFPHLRDSLSPRGSDLPHQIRQRLDARQDAAEQQPARTRRQVVLVVFPRQHTWETRHKPQGLAGASIRAAQFPQCPLPDGLQAATLCIALESILPDRTQRTRATAQRRVVQCLI